MEFFKVVLLVCAAGLPRADCQTQTALQVVSGPDARNELACGLQSQAFLASSAIGRGLSGNEYLKILCHRETTVGVRRAEPVAVTAATPPRAE